MMSVYIHCREHSVNIIMLQKCNEYNQQNIYRLPLNTFLNIYL